MWLFTLYVAVWCCTVTSSVREEMYRIYLWLCGADLIGSQDTGVGVRRRYKHFDWLHTELTKKFVFVAIPPLPGKQLTGACWLLLGDS